MLGNSFAQTWNSVMLKFVFAHNHMITSIDMVYFVSFVSLPVYFILNWTQGSRVWKMNLRNSVLMFFRTVTGVLGSLTFFWAYKNMHP